VLLAHELLFVCLCWLAGWLAGWLRQCCALTKIIFEMKNILFVRRLLKANLDLYIHAPPRSASSVVRLLPDTPREEEDENNEAKRTQQIPMLRRDGERSKVKFVNEMLSFVPLSERGGSPPPTQKKKKKKKKFFF
jgi:hypothetical protein